VNPFRTHWQYARYIVRHKYFVYIAGRVAGVPLFRLLIHDWSKLLPCEWFPYTRYFYGDYPKWDQVKIACPAYDWNLTEEGIALAFERAWLHHIHWNKHHWQYWLLIDDPNSGEQMKALEMPEKYVREMVADWFGAGRAIMHSWDISDWWEKHRSGIILHPKTLEIVEALLAINDYLLFKKYARNPEQEPQ
jgi:hypothetical protein